MPKLTLVRGLPGSGKSTFSKTLGCLHLEHDMFLMDHGDYRYDKKRLIMAVDKCKHFASEAFRFRCDLVVSNTFTQLWEMAWYIEEARKYDYEIVIYRANSKFGSVHNVPEATIVAMEQRFEPCIGEIPVQKEKL